MKFILLSALTCLFFQDDPNTLKAQADALYQQGKTREALVKYAEALGKEDPQAYISEQQRQVTQALLRASTPPRALINPWHPKVGPDFKKYGVWAVPSLLDGLCGEVRIGPFSVISSGFRALGELSIPPLRSLLRSEHARKRLIACEVLGELGVKDKQTLQLLEKLYENTAEEDRVRTAARIAHFKMSKGDYDD